MKSIKEWLETIEDPQVREKALRYHNKDKDVLQFTDADDLGMAISLAFCWPDTEEGVEYWLNQACAPANISLNPS